MWSDLSTLTYQSFGFRRGRLKPPRARGAVDRLRSIDLGLGDDHDDRVRAAILVGAKGRTDDFNLLYELARLDWRDVLMNAGLADDPGLWRPLVGAILRWRGNATTFGGAPAETFGAAAVTLAKAWIGPSWRTDSVLRPILDHLERRPFDDPPREVARMYGDASLRSSELLDHAQLCDDADRWHRFGRDPAQLTRVLDDAARVVYVNSYSAWSQPEAVEKLSDLERATMWSGLRIAPFDTRRTTDANRFNLDADLRDILKH